MTRKAFLQKYFVRFAVSLTLAGLIVYTLYHVFFSTSGSLITTPTRMITDRQIVSGEAYLFREESVLTVPEVGLVNDVAQSGSKVSRGVALTEVWSCSADTAQELQTELDKLNRAIAVLENSTVSADTTLAEAEKYRAAARTDYQKIQAAVTKGDWSQISSLEDGMLTLLNRYGALTGNGDSIGETLDTLKKIRGSLLDGSCTTITNTAASGYFYDRSLVDGYETILTPDALQTLRADDFDALVSSEARVAENGFAVGKMAYGYEWHLALSFDATTAAFFEAGKVCSFAFPENRDMELALTCTKLLRKSDGGAVAVFTSNEIPSNFTFLRSQAVEITVGSCKGYYVPEAALQNVNNVEGVYIFENSTVYFRRIEILYRGNGYCIVAEQSEGDGDYLSLHDVLITSGKDLYEGKVYQ